MLWASIFAFVTAVGSMATATILNNANQHTVSHIISVLWLMAAMGLVAWMKVKVSHPQFGSVSMTILSKSTTETDVFHFVGLLYGCTHSVCTSCCFA